MNKIWAVLLPSLSSLVLAAACGGGRTAGQASQTADKEAETPMETQTSMQAIPFQTITGSAASLADFSGQPVLIVNVASECGYTRQYAGLEELYRKYRDSGLVVIGFPANNFGGQEPGTNEEILKFCTSRFDVTFPMMSKVSVKGTDKHPLFVALTDNSPIPGEIKWNFNKFLLDREGRLVARFGSGTEPTSDEMIEAIRKVL
jgi:glutathione peroxidase